MDTERLVGVLLKHSRQLQLKDGDLYRRRLEITIAKLQTGQYRSVSQLMQDLETLGFADEAARIRREQYANKKT